MLRLLTLALGCSVFLGMFGHAVSAVSPDLVISHVQLGGVGASSQEFVSIFNNADSEINVTGWCVTYSDYSDDSITDLYCFEAAADMDEVRIQPKGSVVIVSPSYPVGASSVTGIYRSPSTVMSGARGHVAIYDGNDKVVDRLAWYNTVSAPPIHPETVAAAAPLGGSMLVRGYKDAVYVDTDHNLNDFSITTSILPLAHPLIDYQKPIELIDLCPNIPETQVTMLDSYDYDNAGNCEPRSADVCQNIEKVQLTVPQYMSILGGNCYSSELDACTNIENFQLDIPDGFRGIHDDSCKVINPKASIVLSELLANSMGTDTGNEFIELQNMSNMTVDLSDYSLAIGKNAEKILPLPETNVAPGQYVLFSDTDLGYTLLNTTTQVKLLFYTGEIVDEIIPYQDPNDDISWSLIDSVWQFTNIVTPGKANVPMAEILGYTGQSSDDGLAPCPAGKYRNTLTNRCRNIEEDASVLASCEADEYRNPETNRCKKIAFATSTLTPCAEGYERNEETNRCRKIQDDAELGSCAEGYERNPETNRCRKSLVAAQPTDVSADVMATDQPSIIASPYALAATVGTGAMGYGLYEWRTEFGAALRRIMSLITKK